MRNGSYDFTSFTTITTPFLGILNLVWIEGFASALAYGRLDAVNILQGVYNFLWAVHFFLVFWSLALAPGISNDSLIESVEIGELFDSQDLFPCSPISSSSVFIYRSYCKDHDG